MAFANTLRKMANIDIKIVSDSVCPWCYMGKKRLERGIKMYKEAHPESKATFSTTWAPFYLNPDAPKSVDKQEYYHKYVILTASAPFGNSFRD